MPHFSPTTSAATGKVNDLRPLPNNTTHDFLQGTRTTTSFKEHGLRPPPRYRADDLLETRPYDLLQGTQPTTYDRADDDLPFLAVVLRSGNSLSTRLVSAGDSAVPGEKLYEYITNASGCLTLGLSKIVRKKRKK